MWKPLPLRFSEDTARFFIVTMSLLTVFAVLNFFILAPFVGYPLTNGQCQEIIKIVLPVFLGYLGAASQFLFRSKSDIGTLQETNSMLLLLVVGPFVIFYGTFFSLLLAFYLGNYPGAPVGIGLTVDQFTLWVSLILGILTVTVSLISGYLFGSSPQKPTG